MKNWKRAVRHREFRRANEALEPFAGVYPTRWKISIEYAQHFGGKLDRKFSYLGKPNGRIAAHVLRVITNARRGFLYASEFDRNGILAYSEIALPRGSVGITDWTHGFRFYYPWLYGDTVLFHQWMSQVNRTPVLFKGKQVLVYTEAAAGQIPESWWETHKAWLNTRNFSWAKPQ